MYNYKKYNNEINNTTIGEDVSSFKMNDANYYSLEDNAADVVNFVVGNVRIYTDLEHTKSILVDVGVSLLRTKQQGYVPLEYFPSEVRGLSDEKKIKEICSKITELEKTAMKNFMNSQIGSISDMGKVFTPGNIIIGDSNHASNGIYVPYVDENSVITNEDIVDPKVKKLIKECYIDKM